LTVSTLGFEHEFEIERVWLLVIIDVCTRAVLGYHLVMENACRTSLIPIATPHHAFLAHLPEWRR
jgi:transposase InsO family protein